jgi:cell division protein FtsB
MLINIFSPYITDSTDEVKEMSAALSALDNKVADLESENEALKEERLVLRERVKVCIYYINCQEIMYTSPEKNKTMCFNEK